MWCPLGEQLRDAIALECPVHCNGGAGHDNNFPFCISIVLENHLMNVVDKGDCEGRKGPAEI